MKKLIDQNEEAILTAIETSSFYDNLVWGDASFCVDTPPYAELSVKDETIYRVSLSMGVCPINFELDYLEPLIEGIYVTGYKVSLVSLNPTPDSNDYEVAYWKLLCYFNEHEVIHVCLECPLSYPLEDYLSLRKHLRSLTFKECS